MDDEVLGQVASAVGIELAQLRVVGEQSNNRLYRCTTRGGCDSVLKVARRAAVAGYVHPLCNEATVLSALAAHGIPVPEVLAGGDAPLPYLLVSVVPGVMVQDRVDPRRAGYAALHALGTLAAFGAALANVHALPIAWSPQLRPDLESANGLQAEADAEVDLARWLLANEPTTHAQVFAHGDFNVANVLVHAGQVSGVLDWEFAGSGWREVDLAWALRARLHFLHSDAERAAVLEGYASVGHFDPDALRWCEVLNYLRFAQWSQGTNEDYRRFAVDRAARLVERA